MNRLEREILLTLLGEEQSIYKLEKSLKDANYTTVWRRINEMQKNGLIKTSIAIRKNGKVDGRATKVLGLTDKGLATLVLEGDLEEEDLQRAGRKILEIDEKMFKFSMEDWFKGYTAETFKETFLAVRPKINLKYFDENWFQKISFDTFLEVSPKVIEKHVKKGDWGTDEEVKKKVEELMKRFNKSKYFKNEKEGLL